MTTRGEVAQSRERLVTAALSLACAERRLPAPAAIPVVNAAERDLILAARDLTATVDDLADIPRDWREAKAS